MDDGKADFAGAMFLVNNRPYCVWEWTSLESNKRFIRSIDPDYFGFLADRFTDSPDDETSKKRAALALRAAYSHALETFIAFLFGALQAPHFVVGWLHLYSLGDLRTLAASVNDGERFASRVEMTSVGWRPVVDALMQGFQLEDSDKEALIKDGFARLWKRFAQDFLDEGQSAEYNSIKHGLRARSGGFRLAIGQESEPGVRANQEAMHSLGGSEFGSSFCQFHKVKEHDRVNLRTEVHHRNWDPERIAFRIKLVSMSLANVLAFLRATNGTQEQYKLVYPTDPSLFDWAWQGAPGVGNLTFGPIVSMETSDLVSDQEVRDSYLE